MEYNFEKLEVYKLSEKLVLEIYSLTRNFPKEEIFGLTSQIKRAVVSISLNIAEGSTGRSKKDFVRFLNTAIGSLVETKSALSISVKLNFTKQENIDKLNQDFDELFFKLIALKKSLNE